MTTSFLRRVLVSACLLAPLMTGSLAQAASTYPDKPIRFVVPFAPGGGTDLIARALGMEMGKALGQPVIVDNKPGASTMIGTDNVAKSAPDGYSVIVASFAHAINPALQPRLPYGDNSAFDPVVLIGRGPNILVVRADSPYQTVADVVTAAQVAPGDISYASQGIGTSAHLAGEMFSNLTGVELLHVPYRGAGPALADLIGGQVDVMFATAASVSGFLSSGKLRALGVSAAEPSAAYPGIPTIAETVPGYLVESWYGLYVPTGTPTEVIERLNAVAIEAAKAPEFVRKLEHEGLVITAGPPADLDTYVQAEEARWARIIQENGIKPE